MTNSENDDKTLKGRGEKSTLRFLSYVFFQVLNDNRLFYGLTWTSLVIYGVFQYFNLLSDCAPRLCKWKPLVDIISGIGGFTAPFIFVIIAVFPSFSEKFRRRLERPSRRTKKPLAQSMLDHFSFVLICSLGMMLIGYLGKYFIESKLISCKTMTRLEAGALSGIVTIVLMLLVATVVELLRSVRTMYIMIVADYTQ